jgi:hypothetical protein
MAFSTSCITRTTFGNKKVETGCWTAAAVTTGTITLGIMADPGAVSIYSEIVGTSTILVVPSANGRCIDLTALETGHCGGYIAWGKRCS